MDSMPAGLSDTVLATLGLILAGSLAVLSLLCRRATLRQRQLALEHWVAARQGKIVPKDKTGPAIPRFEMLAPFHPAARMVIESRQWTLTELRTDPPPEAKDKIPRWRLLAYQSGARAPWPATGLRPVAHAVSLIDLLSLSSYPSLTSGDRFVVFGTDGAAAKFLAESAAQRLLPADVGLLLYGQSLVLDFSPRRFDLMEFERVVAVAEQIMAALP